MPIITCEGWSVCDADVSRMVWNKKKGRKEERKKKKKKKKKKEKYGSWLHSV